MAALLTDLGRHSLDRAMLLPLLFALRGRIDITDALEIWSKQDNSFREAARRHFQDYADVWRDGQSAWKRWEELNHRFVDTERRLLEDLDRERSLVAEKDRQIATALSDVGKWWQESQTAWEKWEEGNARLVDMDGRMAEALAERDRWWSESQTAWKKWEESNQRLVEEVGMRGRVASERDALAARTIELDARCLKLESRCAGLESRVRELETFTDTLLQSRAYRLCNGLLAPARVLRSAITPKE